MRTEVFYKNSEIDGRAKRLLSLIRGTVTDAVENLAMVDVYLTEGIAELTPDLSKELFSDPVAQEAATDTHAADSSLMPDWKYLIEVTYRPGVTNPVAITARNTIEETLSIKAAGIIQTAVQYLIKSPDLDNKTLGKLEKALYNPLIQQSRFIKREEWGEKKLPPIYPYKVVKSEVKVENFDIGNASDEDLLRLSKERLLALTLNEMKSVKSYFKDPETLKKREELGISSDTTDVELEMIAQTWSEHCKHKIFSANINYRDLETGKTERIESVFKNYIKKTTDDLTEKRPFLKSVFHDNSGVIDFDDNHLVCFKVETHNSPSALDPYGGSITGIVGVNRDIMGTGKGAKPFFNTNFLCFGEPDTPEEEIPEGLLHPATVMRGVHHGIIDGGNQSGIPTVAGGFLFDDSFTGKPLVFCGTGGLLPAEIDNEGSWINHINPGDIAVMLGGRIGKDGIHGATFSSQALDEESPSSAVQIGDPITQKKMFDFLLEARDLGLYEGITDNGAGGLSSSLGEMAEYSNGIRIDLDKCPLKYEGLAPWEILVSESQERMSLAVKPEKLERFLSLAEKRDVEATAVGEFQDTGYLDIRYKDKPACFLSIEFLHNGLPAMELEAEWKRPFSGSDPVKADLDNNKMLHDLLNEPNIASKESLVRQYDHEVGGVSVVKPFTGANSDAPSDGAVLRPVFESERGVTVTHGVCPRYSDKDTYDMAMCAVDEAYRAHIGSGGNPEFAAVLDNFCWPDPVESETTPDGKYKLAQLVRACKGLNRACIDYGLPLISGKDSMKNDARMGGKKVSIRPTLLVSLMGIIDNTGKSVTTDFKNPGDNIYILGNTNGELGGTFFEKISGGSYGPAPSVDTETALSTYTRLSDAIQKNLVASCHDISDGGIAVALAESTLGGMTGSEISIDSLPGSSAGETARLLFCESPSRFIVSVSPDKSSDFEKTMKGSPFRLIGKTTDTGKMTIMKNNTAVIEASVDSISNSWKREDF